jgi:repressor LexA
MNQKPKKDLQQRIYAFLVEYMQTQSKPPTIREICEAVQIRSTGLIDYHLNQLEEKGLLLRVRRQSRGIKLTQPMGIPINGRIAAGRPLEHYANPHQVLDVGQDLDYQNTYALEVDGDSMVEDHICSGDYVVIRPQPSCENGEIIVAVHNLAENRSSATLKRFYREHDQVRLQPANSAMDPIVISKDEWDTEWHVQGKVVAIFRKSRPK